MDTTHQGDDRTTARMRGGERERQHWQPFVATAWQRCDSHLKPHHPQEYEGVRSAVAARLT